MAAESAGTGTAFSPGFWLQRSRGVMAAERKRSRCLRPLTSGFNGAAA